MSSPILEKLLQAMNASKGIRASEHAVASVLGALDSGLDGKQEVVEHIIEDVALTQKVLRLANSTMYAPFGYGSASVSSALAVLGSEAVLHLVLGADLVSEEDLKKDESLSRTLLASELARSACSERSEDASIATLMYEIGRLMASKYLDAESAAIAKRVAGGAAPSDAALEVLGMSYQDLGIALARRWNMPPAILANMDGSGDPALIHIARLCSSASSLIHEGRAEDADALLSTWELPDPDKWRLASVVSSKLQELASARKPRTEPSAVGALSALLRMLTDEKKSSVEELSAALLPGMADALKTAHCMLFMRTRTGEMRVRMGYGKGIDELKSKLRVSAEFQPTAFPAAIKNKRDISIADLSKLKDSALPEGYRALLPNINTFILLPIANSQVSGLLYCDWDSDQLLQPAEVEAMKKLRGLFLPLFPQ